MVLYSHSKLSTFEQCPLKFKFRYIDRLTPDFEQSIEGFLGNQTHDVLEWIYNHPEKDLELDEIIQTYIANWNKNFNPNIRIIKQNYDSEYYFNKGIRFLINYFLKHSPFKDNTIATEKKIILNLDSEGRYQIQGYIDRIVHHPDTNVFEIHDYKTGAMKSQKELDSDRQLALYALGVKEEFENVADVHLFWHFLEFNEQKFSKRTEEQLSHLKKEIIDLINKIESTKDFQPNPGGLCNWCEFKTNCPAIKENSNYSENKKIYKQPENNRFENKS